MPKSYRIGLSNLIKLNAELIYILVLYQRLNLGTVNHVNCTKDSLPNKIGNIMIKFRVPVQALWINDQFKRLYAKVHCTDKPF